MRNYLAISLIFLIGCIEPFNPTLPIEEQANRLVVDGRITDQDGPYTVRLSHSKAISSDLPTLVETGAIVIIEEENGPLVTLVENQPGIYLTNPADLKGEVGKSYRLSIRLSDESEYLSSWELIRETPEIDEIRIEPVIKDSRSGSIAGGQLYIDTQDSTGQSSYFRWEMLETWKYSVPLSSTIWGTGHDDVKDPEDIHRVCWIQRKRKDIMLETVDDLSESTLINHPVAFVSSDSARFNIRYTLLIKQYVLGIEEYFFWRDLRNTNENVGILYDKQPFQVTGNIKSVINEDQAVFGFFSANSVKEKRVYINRDDFPEQFLPPKTFSDCEVVDLSSAGPGVINFYLTFGYYLFAYAEHFYTIPICGDCEAYGGSTVEPIFWED